MIKITQIWVVFRRFIMRLPTEMLAYFIAKRRFSRADIAGNCDVFYRAVRSVLICSHNKAYFGALRKYNSYG